MKKFHIPAIILFILGLLITPCMVSAKEEIPPEEMDRILKAKARRERAKLKSKPKEETPAKTTPQKTTPNSNYYYRSTYGPAYKPVQKDPGIYNIESRPPGAEVVFKGKVIGKTPCTFADRPGAYALNLKMAGYEDVQIGVIIKSKMKKKMTIQMEEN